MPAIPPDLSLLQQTDFLHALGLAFFHAWPAVAAGFFAGFVDSIGGGGGLISVPAFIAAGVPLPLVLGTNKSMACTGTWVSVIRYIRGGALPKIQKASWITLVLLSICLGAGGAALSTLPWIQAHLKTAIPFMLGAVMLFLIHRWFLSPPHTRAASPSIDPSQIPALHPPEAHLDRVGPRTMIGLISAYDGVFGPGTGTFFLSYLEKIGLRTVNANAVTKVLNLGSNLGALVFFALNQRVLWPVGLAAAGSFMMGNYLGAGLVLRRGQALVRISVMLTTSLLLIKYAWSG